MASNTETTLLAFVAILQALSGVGSPAIPAPLRNEVLPTRLPTFGSGSAFLNVLDGDGGGSSEGGSDNVALGSSATQFELVHEPTVEWIFESSDTSAREAGFDAGLVAIYDALMAENAIPGVNIVLKSIQRSNLNTDGLPGTKAAALMFQLTFTSSRPF